MTAGFDLPFFSQVLTMNKQDLGRYNERLTTMYADIEKLSADRDASSEVVELDQTRTGRVSRMDAMQQQAMAVANRERAVGEKQRIMAELERIADGQFGECKDCGQVIASARLNANPTVDSCITCAEKREQE